MSEITKTKSLQEKLSDKIKESLGDLITDEDLKPLVEQSIESLLMKERVIDGSPSYNKTVKPPLLQSLMEPAITEKVKERVDIWFSENTEKMSEVIDGVIEKGLMRMMINHMDNKLSQPLYEFQNKLQEIFDRNNII